MPESGGRNHFKLRRTFQPFCCHGFDFLPDDSDSSGKVSTGNIIAVNMYPFGVFFQMGRRVLASPETSFTKSTGYHGRYRPFAIGSSNMNRLIFFLGIAQPVQEFLNPAQAQLYTKHAGMLDIINCFFVGHERLL